LQHASTNQLRYSEVTVLYPLNKKLHVPQRKDGSAAQLTSLACVLLHPLHLATVYNNTNSSNHPQ